MNYRQYFKQQFATIIPKDIELQDGFSVTELHAIENIFSSLPVALQEYYHLIGKHPINKEHNRILAPNEIYYIGDYLVFAEENENVVAWGILKSDLQIEDPVVYQGQEYNGKYSWYSEDSTFSRFVIQMFKWQRGIE